MTLADTENSMIPMTIETEKRGAGSLRRMVRRPLCDASNKTICPQCGNPMLLHFADNPFRPIVACRACETYVNEQGQIKTCVG